MRGGYTLIRGSSPIVATAIHDGHQVRCELNDYFNLNDKERLREEDPFTATWANFTDNRIIVHRSRFETDVNRPRDKAVYQKPADAWNLKVWKEALPDEVVNRSLAIYDQFYYKIKNYFNSLFEHHEYLVVYDIHSYNYRREGKDIDANPEANPEINIGTGNLDKTVWHSLVQVLMDCFRSFDYNGHHLDVRENIKFKGGYFGQWLYHLYGHKICPVSIEFKKFFMDEWSGKPYLNDLKRIYQLLASSKIPVLNAIHNLKQSSFSYA